MTHRWLITGGGYIDSGYASEMQNMNPIKYDAKEYVDEQLARLEKQNPNLVGA